MPFLSPTRRLTHVLLAVGAAVLLAGGCGRSGDDSRQAAGRQPPAPEAGMPGGEDSPSTPAAEPRRQGGELPGVLLAMIDNHPSARPQSGLDRADVVYEAEAEGGITRFLAVFFSRRAEEVGPIRSARYYFVQIARAYEAPFAHAGGSPDALEAVRALGVPDLDEIHNAGGFFWRSSGRRPPHNLYTGTERLWEGAVAKGFRPVPLRGWPVGTVPGGTPCDGLTLRYADSGPYKYEVAYRWSGGRYQRLIDGHPHRTAEGTALAVDNVVVVLVPPPQVKPLYGKVYELLMDVLGEGKALFFTGGKVYEGAWRKEAPEDPFAFTFAGEPMRFARGTTWVQIIQADRLSACPDPANR